MTSPLSLLTALGAAEPASTAPVPAPEDPGLFTAALTAALQAGIAPQVPLAAAVPVALEPPPMGEQADADGADEGDATTASSADSGAETPGSAAKADPTPTTEAPDGGPRAPVPTGRPAGASPPRQEDGAGAGPVPTGTKRSLDAGAPATARDASPERASKAARNARATAHALALLESERPAPRLAGEIARGRTTVPVTTVTTPAAAGHVDAGTTVRADADVRPALTDLAAPSAPPAPAEPGVGAAPPPQVSVPPLADPVAAVRGPAIGAATVREPRPRRAPHTAPASSTPASGSVPSVVDTSVPLTGERAVPQPQPQPQPAPLPAAWNAARRAAMPVERMAPEASTGLAAEAPRPAREEAADEREPATATADGRARGEAVVSDPLPTARVLVAAPPVSPLDRAGRPSAAEDDEAEALIARARRNLEQPEKSAPALPRTRLVGAPPRAEPRGAPQGGASAMASGSAFPAGASGGVMRAAPTVPAVEALMEALGRTLEGAEIAAVRVTMGQGRSTGVERAELPDPATAGEAGGKAATPTVSDPATGVAAPKVTVSREPVERGAPVDRRPRAPAPAGAADDGDTVAAPVDRLVVERAPTPVGRADLTGFEPTSRALREAVAARPTARPAPDLPSDRQELPVTASGGAPRAARRDREERTAEPAPSDAGARGSAHGPDGSLRAARAAEGAERGGVREAHELREAWVERGRPAGAADRVTLQVADSDGRQTRIRVAVLGDQVRATILPPDSTSARQLEQRMDELQAALVRQGFTDAKVTVQAGRGDGALPWGAGQPVAPHELRSSSGTDQPPGDQRQGTGRRDGERQGDGQRHPHQRPRERDLNDRRKE